MIRGGTCYFTLDYVYTFETKLPEEFTEGLNNDGDGTILIRYGGWRIPVVVRKRVLNSGWHTFVNRAKVVSGTILLAAHSVGRNISILKFKKGMGKSSVWDLNSDAFDIKSGFLEEDFLPENSLAATIRTSYFPEFMSLFFAKRSGVCLYEQTNYHTMRVPLNLAQHLTVQNQTEVSIRSGERVFANIDVSLGYFRGFRWSTLAEECALDIGFKLFFFLNPAEEFEMIVIGYNNLEVVYEWSRTYYKLI